MGTARPPRCPLARGRSGRRLLQVARLKAALAATVKGQSVGGAVRRGKGQRDDRRHVGARGSVECRTQKLAALKEESTWQRSVYVGKKKWVTMPGEQDPDSRVAQGLHHATDAHGPVPRPGGQKETVSHVFRHGA